MEARGRASEGSNLAACGPCVETVVQTVVQTVVKTVQTVETKQRGIKSERLILRSLRSVQFLQRSVQRSVRRDRWQLSCTPEGAE